MNGKKTKNVIIVLFLVNLLLIGVYGYLFFITESKHKETSILYIASQEHASDNERIKDLERALKDTEIERGQLSEYFSQDTNAVAFIEQVEKIGKNTSVDLSVNSVSDTAKDNGVIELNFSAAGSFQNLYRLLSLIESLPHKVLVKKVAIQSVSTQNEKWNWKGDFIVTLENFSTASASTTTKFTEKE